MSKLIRKLSKLAHRALCRVGVHAYEGVFEMDMEESLAAGEFRGTLVSEFCPVCDKTVDHEEKTNAD